MVLRCPLGSVVKIMFAVYGRTDNKTCVRWNQVPVVRKPTQYYSVTPLMKVNSGSSQKNFDEYRPCFRSETTQLRHQCWTHKPSRDECVIFVDSKFQFSEPICKVPLGYVDKLINSSRYAVVEYGCIQRDPFNSSETKYIKPNGYIIEKGSTKLTQKLANRILGKASITTYNQQMCQDTSELQRNDTNDIDLENEVYAGQPASRRSKRQEPTVRRCVSLDGIRLKNVRHLISLKKKSSCNDIFVVGGTEHAGNDHLIRPHKTKGVIRKRAHQNGYRIDIVASNPSQTSFKASNAGLCVSSYIRKNFLRLSPTTFQQLNADLGNTTLTDRQLKQIKHWNARKMYVYNDTSENGGVIYKFIEKPVPMWDILYP